MTDNYTINDAWEDGYQVGYERGIMRMMEYLKYETATGLDYIDIMELGKWLITRTPKFESEEDCYDLLSKAVSQ